MLRELVPTLRRPLGLFDRDFDRMINRFMGPTEEWFKEVDVPVPAINMAETEEGFEVTADLPGMKPEDVKVEIRNGDLWITGEKKEEKEEKGKTFHRVERTYGRFNRVIPLPGAVREAAIEAACKDGVLRITLPKVAEAKPKSITVKNG